MVIAFDHSRRPLLCGARRRNTMTERGGVFGGVAT